MRRFVITAMLLVGAVQFVFATTYFKNWVNGSVADTMTQGDFYAWEYDVSAPGGSAHIQLYLDVNHNRTLDSTDVLLVEFDQTDGSSDGQEGPPPDSSSTPDGIVYTQLGPFGFAPTDYLFHVEDLGDHSTVVGTLHINPPAQVNVWVSGHLSIEGIQAPDDRLANFMIEATVEDQDEIGWSGITDRNGDFTINLPDSAVGKSYKISFSFESQLGTYLPETEAYHNVIINNGENSGYDFSLLMPHTWVYGSVLDEGGQLVPVQGWGSLVNTRNNLEAEFQTDNGQYKVGAIFGENDSSNVPFHLNYWSDALIPDYLIPNTWDNPYYDFQLSRGDSVEKNIIVYSSNAVIYVIARQDSQPLSGSYRVNANNEQYGQTYTMCNGDLISRLHVHSDAVSATMYNVGLSNAEDGNLHLPPGYYVVPQNWQQAFPGDTVKFFIKRSPNLLKGHIHFAPGDVVGDLQNCIVEAFTANWDRYIQAPIDPDSLSFLFGVPSDTFTVRVNCWSGDYLVNPVEYDNIIVQNDTIEGLDFTLNYAHANLVVKLKNAPVNTNDFYWLHIATEGEFPNIYQTDAQIQPDTTFQFRVCDGRWDIVAPYFNEQYVADPPMQTVDVSNDSSNYYVEFNYVTTGIEDREPIPKSFYVKQNYPNPFNPSTTLEFGLPQQQQVTVSIYNLAGQKVSTLFNGTMSAGVHRLKWQANDLASGMYFYKIQTPKKTVIKRMLLIK